MIICAKLVELLPQYIMAIGVFFAAFAFIATRKTNYLTTIENCSNEYRAYMRKIQKGKADAQLKQDMLGLFHKQLFYIEKSYVPKDIKIEWTNTMHSVLKENKFKSEGLEFDETDWQNSFERVSKFMAYLNDKSLNRVVKKHYLNFIEKLI